ncbi:Ribosomal protein S18 acetylase RimI [Lachnospiraceae bacterium]|nr:Ribosomal protein S18 acetylase RimI [Lachnospiraceae bacterium]
MIDYKITTEEDIDLLMESRLVMLREVNDLSEDYKYSEDFIDYSKDYFLSGDQTTVLAFDGEQWIGCASISYIRVMPTFDHVSGKRAHLMNVYTRPEYRGKGIAYKMADLLIKEAWERGVTEVSLDATEAGRPLYRKLGFNDSTECMVLTK